MLPGLGNSCHDENVFRHGTWTLSISTTKQRQTDFITAAAKRRRQIEAVFYELQAAVHVTQQNALNALDEITKAGLKQFSVELVSLEVLANQAAVATAAAAAGAVMPENNADYVGASVVVPEFVAAPLEVLKAVLAECWSFAAPTQPWVYKRHSFKALREHSVVIQDMQKLKAQTLALEKMSSALNSSLKHLKEVYSTEQVALLNSLSSLRFQGKLITTYQVDFDVGGLAVMEDASLFAVSDYGSSGIWVYRLPYGNKLTRFGNKGNGPGQFDGPLRLCFTSTGTLLVADSENKRVQEVTVTGDHVRFLQSDAIKSPVVHVVCNTKAVVATQKSGFGTFSVFDMVTGEMMAVFGECGRDPGCLRTFFDTSLSFDGTIIQVAETGPNRISLFDFNGSSLGAVGDASTLNLVRSVAELPDGRIVAANAGNQRLVIFRPTKEATDENADVQEVLLPMSFDDKTCCIKFACGFLFSMCDQKIQMFC